MTTSKDNEPREYKLASDNELRFVVGPEEVTVELLDGRAELFGTELIRNKRYTFPPGRVIAIYAYDFATIELVGGDESTYVSDNTPMRSYLQIHTYLEKQREKAYQNLKSKRQKLGKQKRGPRLLIAGSMDVGKSTIARILCNYAVRSCRTPIYVDIDVGQGSISVPGTVGALFLEKTADVITGYDTKSSLTLHYGYSTPSANFDLYLSCLKTLADYVHKKSMSTDEINASGIIINTCGWVDKQGYESLTKAAEEFEVDTVVIIEHERLYHSLKKDLPSLVTVHKVSKSSGIEPRTRDMRAAARTNAIHNYFYGDYTHKLCPHSFPLTFDSVIVAKIGAEALPDSCLPFGMKLENCKTKVVKMNITPDIKDHLLAVMPPGSILDQSLLTTPCVGYVVITNVDMDNKVIHVLSPQPSPLPCNILLFSDVTFIDDNNIV
ncbi:Polyribonucleotide 5'-hydroxyl-kinase Clp1 [Strongyloides ratti]|uniref:Polyribonucleotide 5'-hydroxyl-kinase Clp1 n=1 Tax=Strongyloides ratti TaxID=34506 RepID=A0A090MXT4_STRRB|nr:Polyribonucleotide 5'-hydroxyl-kinase Clp1 [Strongyloides ratti]CEF65989.1 Polyribonucleotide 5'-hydroxyl-kinase Clp1 [Strongyloides ratti]